MRAPLSEPACVRVPPLPRAKFDGLKTGPPPEECMAEAIFCLDRADRCRTKQAKALCLGIEALWQELATFAARLDAQGVA